MTKIQPYNNPGEYLQHRNPFSLFENLLEREFNHPFFWGDVSRTGDTVRFRDGEDLTVEVDLPGVPKDKTKITVDGRVVLVEGSRKVVYKGGSQEESFSRSFNVGTQYDIDNAKAEQKDGVLVLTFPRIKRSESPRKTIEIT